jgi:SAM-dependent methyltransferase
MRSTHGAVETGAVNGAGPVRRAGSMRQTVGGGVAEDGRCDRMDAMQWASGIDTERPSAARMYDYWLGGSHNFRADRDAAHRMVELMPTAPAVAQANRAFLNRAVRALVASGIDQFLDIGSGIPTLGNVHEIAARTNRGTRVVYVDIDPVAVMHSRQILSGNNRTAVLMADLRQPDVILESPEVTGTLDLARPVALLLVSVLHFVPEADDPYAAVGHLRDALAPDSHLVLSHAASDGFAPEVLAEAPRVYQSRPSATGGARTAAQLMRFFGDFELVDPGLVWLTEWRPEHPDDVHAEFAGRPERSAFRAGVARKRG